MSWIDRLLGRKDARTLDQLPGFLMGPDSKSGVSVTFSTALQVAAVLACVKVVAEGIAQSPCKLLAPRPGGGADAARDHPLFWKLYRQPFGRQTAFEFWETVVAHVMLTGNAFVFINRVADRVHELIGLEPGKVNVCPARKGAGWTWPIAPACGSRCASYDPAPSAPRPSPHGSRPCPPWPACRHRAFP